MKFAGFENGKQKTIPQDTEVAAICVVLDECLGGQIVGADRIGPDFSGGEIYSATIKLYPGWKIHGIADE